MTALNQIKTNEKKSIFQANSLAYAIAVSAALENAGIQNKLNYETYAAAPDNFMSMGSEIEIVVAAEDEAQAVSLLYARPRTGEIFWVPTAHKN